MEQFESIVLQPADGPVATSSDEQMTWITRLQDKEVSIILVYIRDMMIFLEF